MSLNFIQTVNADELYLFNIPLNSLLTVDKNNKVVAYSGSVPVSGGNTGVISGDAKSLSVEVYNELYRIFMTQSTALATFIKKTDIDLTKYLLVSDANNIFALKNDNMNLINTAINDLKNWTSTNYYSNEQHSLFSTNLSNNYVSKVLLASTLNNYYDKTSIDTLLRKIVEDDILSELTKEEVNVQIQNYIKTNLPLTYTKFELDSKFSLVVDKNYVDTNFLKKLDASLLYYSRSDVDSKFALIGNIPDVSIYQLKTEMTKYALFSDVDNKINLNNNNYYLRTNVDTLISNLQTQINLNKNNASLDTKAVSDNLINNYYNKTFVDNNYYNRSGTDKRIQDFIQLADPFNTGVVKIGSTRYEQTFNLSPQITKYSFVIDKATNVFNNYILSFRLLGIGTDGTGDNYLCGGINFFGNPSQVYGIQENLPFNYLEKKSNSKINVKYNSIMNNCDYLDVYIDCVDNSSTSIFYGICEIKILCSKAKAISYTGFVSNPPDKLVLDDMIVTSQNIYHDLTLNNSNFQPNTLLGIDNNKKIISRNLNDYYNKTEIDNKLALEGDLSYVNQELAKKINISDNEILLNKKSDILNGIHTGISSFENVNISGLVPEKIIYTDSSRNVKSASFGVQDIVQNSTLTQFSENYYNKTNSFSKTEISDLLNNYLQKTTNHTFTGTTTVSSLNLPNVSKNKLMYVDDTGVLTSNNVQFNDVESVTLNNLKLGLKTDKTYVDLELSKKVDKISYNTDMLNKANVSDIYTRTEIDNKLALEGDLSYVNQELAKKVNLTDYTNYTNSNNTNINSINSSLLLKSDKTYVDTQLNLKANLASPVFTTQISTPKIVLNSSTNTSNKLLMLDSTKSVILSTVADTDLLTTTSFNSTIANYTNTTNMNNALNLKANLSSPVFTTQISTPKIILNSATNTSNKLLMLDSTKSVILSTVADSDLLTTTSFNSTIANYPTKTYVDSTYYNIEHIDEYFYTKDIIDDKFFVTTNFYAKDEVNDRLALKSDLTYVNTELSKKVNKTEMEKYALTVDIDSNYYPNFHIDTYFYEKQVIDSMIESEKTYVNSELSKKVNLTDYTNNLNTKSNIDNPVFTTQITTPKLILSGATNTSNKIMLIDASKNLIPSTLNDTDLVTTTSLNTTLGTFNNAVNFNNATSFGTGLAGNTPTTTFNSGASCNFNSGSTLTLLGSTNFGSGAVGTTNSTTFRSGSTVTFSSGSTLNLFSTTTFNSNTNFNSTTNFSATTNVNAGSTFNFNTNSVINFTSRPTFSNGFNIGTNTTTSAGTVQQFNGACILSGRAVGSQVALTTVASPGNNNTLYCGTLNYSTLVSASDKRIKTNIQNINKQDVLDNIIMKLNVVEYDLINNKTKEGQRMGSIKGFIAQEVRAVDEDLINIESGHISNIMKKIESLRLIRAGEGEQNILLCKLKNYKKLINENTEYHFQLLQNNIQFSVFGSFIKFANEDEFIILNHQIDINEFIKGKYELELTGEFVQDFHSINHNNFVPMLTASVQFLRDENLQLKKQIKKQEALINMILGKLGMSDHTEKIMEVETRIETKAVKKSLTPKETISSILRQNMKKA